MSRAVTTGEATCKGERADPAVVHTVTIAASVMKNTPSSSFLLTRFRQLICRAVRSPARTHPAREYLRHLIEAKVIVPGVDIIAVRGKESETTAELTPEGNIIFNGVAFNSPSSFVNFAQNARYGRLESYDVSGRQLKPMGSM